MVHRSFLRSLIFNICFYTYMVVGSFGLFWMFFIPKRWAIKVVGWYFNGVTYLEKWILGLTLQVHGRENLPADGRYILAMKHQSAYETLKLVPVFGNVAIALKRELTWIPLWGWYTIKTGMIPIDRGARGKAMDSLIAGSRKAMDAGRPIVIYPQGTRVPIGSGTDKYPYKAGVVRMAQTLGVPIVPVAINSGVFWAKRAFIKGAGCVEFDIMPAIHVQDRKTSDVMKELENTIETRSNELAANAKTKSTPRSILVMILGVLAVLFAAWSAWWLHSAHNLRQHIDAFAHENVKIVSKSKPTISGYPFKMKAEWPDIRMVFDDGSLYISYLKGEAWPILGTQVNVRGMGSVKLMGREGGAFPNLQITLQGAQATFTPVRGGVHLNFIELLRTDSRVVAAGDIFVPIGNTDKKYNGEMNLMLFGPSVVVAILQENGIIERKTALLVRSLIHTLMQNREDQASVDIPLRVLDGGLYAHILPIMRLEREPEPTP